MMKRRLCVVLWAVAQLGLDWKWGSLARRGPYEYVQLALVVTLLFVDSKPLTIATFVARAGGLLVRLPKVWDAEVLACLTDLTVAAALFFDEACLQRALRWELGIFYVAAALWKVNDAFLDPRYSCGTTYAVQLVVAFGLEKYLATPATLRLMGPFTVLLEASIGVFTFFETTTHLAIGLCLALHTAIALTPPPNNIAGFGVVALVRYFWLLLPPKGGDKIGDDGGALFFLVVSAMILGAAVLLGATKKFHGTEFDGPAAVFGAFAAVLAAAAAFPPPRSSSKEGTGPNPPLTRRGGVVVGAGATAMALWSVGSVMLGVLDGSSPNMFSNIRMSGGSNHLFSLLPTGLLQRWHYDDASSVFGGGVLRVEASNSSLLNAIHPGELTAFLAHNATEALRALGAHDRFYNSAVANVIGTFVMPHHDVAAPRYTVPAFEVHRVLRLERHVPVRLTVTKLDGPLGDEHWRRHSGNHTATLLYSPFYPHLASCTRSDGLGCTRDDLFHLTFVNATKTFNWGLNSLGDRLQMWNSYVIYDDDQQTKLHCYGS